MVKKKKVKIKSKMKGVVMNKKHTRITTGKYHFNEEEKKGISKELANKHVDRSIVEDEKKSVMSRFKDRLDRFKLDLGKLSRCVIDGYELREFECWIEKDYDKHIKRYIDIHTEKVVDERPLDPSDYQIEMDDN